MTESINSLNSDLFERREREAPDPKTARKKAMDFLARREYGQAELIGRLKAAGFAADVAEEAVEKLTADGLQDDARYATSFVNARVSRGSGPLRIASALKERGLAASLVDRILEEAGVDWYAEASAARQKKFGLGACESYAEKARQMRFLQYRGFDMEQIRHAMGEG